MKFARSWIVLAAMSVLGSSPVFSRKTDAAALRETGASFSDCVVKKHYDRASEFILSMVDNETAVKRYRMLIDSSCMGNAIENTGFGGMRFSGDTFAYGIAEALVRKDFAGAGPQSFDDRASLNHRAPEPLDDALLAKLKPKKQVAARESYQTNKAWSVISQFGECGARVAPELVRKLAQTEVNSPEERALLTELAPQVGVCLPEGVQVKFKPLQLRGTLMMNYFRLAAAPVVPPAKINTGGE
jgi:hypothetical protein